VSDQSRHTASESALAIKQQFDHAFANWGIELPRGATDHLAPGWLQTAGWSIAFAWGWDDSSLYLDYEAEHRMPDPTHVRLRASREREELDAPADTVPLGFSPSDEQVAATITEAGDYNRAIATLLAHKGLWPWKERSNRVESWEANGFNPHDVVAQAAAVAARNIDTSGPKASFLESRIEVGMQAALSQTIDETLLGARREEFKVPGWMGDLRGIDMYVRHPNGSLRVAAELKVDDVEWILWDLFKLANVFEIGSVEAAFLIVAARRSVWSSQRDCVALLSGQPGSCLRWDSRLMLRDWEKAWQGLLKGGPARPTHLPAAIEVEVIAADPVPAYPDYELRVAAIRPVPGAGIIQFAGDWPAE
jgi:hypothetical protein